MASEKCLDEFGVETCSEYAVVGGLNNMREDKIDLTGQVVMTGGGQK
jgi:hypothetical protein